MAYTADQLNTISMASDSVVSWDLILNTTPEEDVLIEDIKELLVEVGDIPLQERLEIIRDALQDIKDSQ